MKNIFELIKRFSFKLKYKLLILYFKIKLNFSKNNIYKIKLKKLNFKFLFNLDIREDLKFYKRYPTKLMRVVGDYEPNTTRIIGQMFDKEDNIIELGACYGYFTIQLAEKCNSVHSVEPNNDYYKILNSNIKINNLQNVKSYNIAVGEEGRIVDLANSNSKKCTKLLSFIQKNKLTEINSFFIDCDAKNLDYQEIDILEDILNNFNQKLKIFIETKKENIIQDLAKKNNLNFLKVTNRHFYLSRQS